MIGSGALIGWLGVVEDRHDPAHIGRAKVRIFGKHTEDNKELSTDSLPWCSVSVPIDSGTNGVGLREGDWVWGIFMDGGAGQKPLVCGVIPGINTQAPNPEVGFGDQRKDVDPSAYPVPPYMQGGSSFNGPTVNISALKRVVEKLNPPEEIKTAINKVLALAFDGGSVVSLDNLPNIIQNVLGKLSEVEEALKDLFQKAITWLLSQIPSILELLPKDLLLNSASDFVDKFSNPNVLPGGTIAFGELLKNFSMSTTKLDKNGDGVYDQEDADIIYEQGTANGPYYDPRGLTPNISNAINGAVKASAYPHPDKIQKPSLSSVAIGEDVSLTPVQFKKENLSSGEGPGFSSGDATVHKAGFGFTEPETPYGAAYPYNHVYESESGHLFEMDDTPGKERVHIYHRSGSFQEYHPDGTVVDKSQKQRYNFIVEDYFIKSDKSINVDASDSIRVGAGSNLIRAVGGDMDANVSGGYHLDVAGGVYIYAKGDGVYIKTPGKVCVESSGDGVELRSAQQIILGAPKITLQGQFGGTTQINLNSFDIRALLLVAHLAGASEIPFGGSIPLPSQEAASIKNDADVKAQSQEESASLKPGYLWGGGTPGELMKPSSASNGNMCSLSYSATPHVLMSVKPVGQLEAAKIKYDNDQGQISEWEVVRAKLVPDQIIETASTVVAFEAGDGRYIHRFTKPGKKYPPNMFLITETGPKLILDSSQRHECKAPFVDAVPFFPPPATAGMIPRETIESAIDSLPDTTPNINAKLKQVSETALKGRPKVSITDLQKTFSSAVTELKTLGGEENLSIVKFLEMLASALGL